jgi:hypothetical protein
MDKLFKKRKKLVEQLSKLELEELPANPEDYSSEHWKYILHETEGMDRYYFCQSVVEKYGLRFSGYQPTTNQKCLQLCFVRDDKEVYNNHLKLLKMILPSIIPCDIECEDGSVKGKYLGILDSGLSEYAVYFAIVNEEQGIYWAMQTRYCSVTCNGKFDSLEKLMEYLNTNHYYYRTKKDD